MPRGFAQSGDSLSACSPTFCSSSDSRPCSPGFFDSGEPRSTNQIVASMKSMNCRYSDCQFSITALPKSEETM